MFITDHKSFIRNESKTALNLTSLIDLFESANLSTWTMEFPTASIKFSKIKTDQLGFHSNKLTHYIHFTDLLHPDDYESSVEALADLLSGKNKIYDSTHRLRKKDGNYIWFRDIGKIVTKTPDGKKILQGISYDITPSMESLQKYKKILFDTEAAVWEFNLKDQSIALYNDKAWNSITGLASTSPSNITFQKFLDFFHDNDQSQIGNNINKLKFGDIKEFQIESRVKNKNGDFTWINFKCYRITDNNNQLDKITGTLININELKRLEFENIKLLKAVEQSNSIFVITDTFGIVEYANTKFFDSTGYKNDEIINNKISIIKSGLLSREFYEDLWRTIKAGNTWRGEFVNKKKNGELFYEKAVISAIRNQSGEIVRYFQVSEDITELKRAKESAINNEKVKSEFLAQMSHEIRTPINAMLTFASLLELELGEQVDDELREKFRIMKRASKRITRTVDLILNLSEINVGTYKPSFRKIDINEQILEPLCDEFRIIAKEKGLLFVNNLEEKISKIFIDEYTVTQIFVNLIENAIIYTKSGRIEVNSYTNENQLVIEIADTGIGISKEYHSQIFKPFTQEDTGYTRRFEGNGLGLALTKEYCEINNAKITFTSEQGKGSIFTVKFKI